jgi:hypothetical protein
MKEEVNQLQINAMIIKIMTSQTDQIKVLAEGLVDLNKRLDAMEGKKPKSFL